MLVSEKFNLIALIVEDYIFENRSELQSIEDVRFGFFRQIYRLRIATSFNVKYSVITPHMFIIAD